MTHLARVLRLLLLLTGTTVRVSTQQQPSNKWDWDRNHYVPTSSSSTPIVRPERGRRPSDFLSANGERRTLVIVQDTGPDDPAQDDATDITSRVNRAYAKQWRYDYLRFVGILSIGRLPWQATFNPVFLLRTFLDAKNNNENSGFPVCDAVMFLNSDAMIVDLDSDVISLLPNDKLLAIGVTYTRTGTSLLYPDVMLWNLNHPQVETISNQWMDRAQNAVGDDMVDSRSLLQDIFREEFDELDTAKLIYPIPQPLLDGWSGTLIKQGGDDDFKNINVDTTDLTTIMPRLQGIADSVCYKFYPQCEVI